MYHITSSCDEIRDIKFRANWSCTDPRIEIEDWPFMEALKDFYNGRDEAKVVRITKSQCFYWLGSIEISIGAEKVEQ